LFSFFFCEKKNRENAALQIFTKKKKIREKEAR